jgi:hypothetical protein
MAIGTPGLRCLRQRHEQGGLGGRQPARLLAEIGQRRGAHAFDIAAIRGELKVEVKDFVLAQPFFQGQGGEHLVQLAPRLPRRSAGQQAGDLHGDGGGAGDGPAVADQLERGARQRADIDAAMRAEAAVLISQQTSTKSGSTSASVVGRRQRPSLTAKGRSNAPLRSSTRVPVSGSAREARRGRRRVSGRRGQRWRGGRRRGGRPG